MNDLVYVVEDDVWIPPRENVLNHPCDLEHVPEDITFSVGAHNLMLRDKTLFIPNPGYFRPQGRGLSHLVVEF